MALGAAWFLAELHLHGAPGAAERAVTTIQSVWPFAVVLSCFSFPRSMRDEYRG
jgi:hypothetical protein